MEHKDEEITEKEFEELTVDLSKHSLKRIERADDERKSAAVLILDNNEIQRLDNLETYSNVKKLSLVNNQLIRMYGVSNLVLLQSLDLSSNSLVTIEGLKDLLELKYLNLAKNRIKTIEHLNSNFKLEKIDLSENNIMHISDISFLENLKELNLHGNRISLLKHCEKNLPANLEILTINNNSLTDLNEISHLVQLTSLKELSIVNNPCLDFSEDQKFNYRPFVKNWCSGLIVLDNCPLDDIECLKAEWLYSQGRGRSFRPGEHAALIEYLISVCPKEAGEDAETEDVKKLKLILSKAQLHQQELRAQLSTGKFAIDETPRSSFAKKKSSGVLPERMVTSFQDIPSKNFKQSSELMTRSLDSGIIRNSSRILRTDSNQTPLQTSTTFIPIPDTLISPDVAHPIFTGHRGPSSVSSRTSRSSSRNSPYSTPESKRKTSTIGLRKQDESLVTTKKQGKLFNSKSSFPLSKSFSLKGMSSPSKGSIERESDRNCRETSEEEDSEVLAMKIRSIQVRVDQRRQSKMHHLNLSKEHNEQKENFEVNKKKNAEKDLRGSEVWRAAVCIQRRWRGYRARNLNKEVLTCCKDIQLNRMQDYIMKVMNDMEATRIALEGNRKLVVLQMQAINALWKKMTALQPAVVSNSGDEKVSLENLVETCSSLNKQVESLQEMMKTMRSSSSLIPMGTQTEIVAVHTPQSESKELFFSTSKPKLSQTSIESHPSNTSSEIMVQNFQDDTSDVENALPVGSVKTLESNCSGTGTPLKLKKTIEKKSVLEITDASGEEGFAAPESQEEKDETMLCGKLSKPSVMLSEDSLEAELSKEANTELGNVCDS